MSKQTPEQVIHEILVAISKIKNKLIKEERYPIWPQLPAKIEASCSTCGLPLLVFLAGSSNNLYYVDPHVCNNSPITETIICFRGGQGYTFTPTQTGRI